MYDKMASRRSVLRSIGSATAIGVISATAVPEFIEPAQAAPDYKWLETDSKRVETDDSNNHNATAHCASLGARGSYEIPDRNNEFMHMFTFGGQGAVTTGSGSYNCIEYQEYKVQGNHSSIYNINSGTADGEGIYPRAGEDWNWGQIAQEVATEAAEYVHQYIDWAMTAIEILDAMVKASPDSTSESYPGYIDSESYGFFNEKSQAGHNTSFHVHVENTDWVTVDSSSIIHTATDYLEDTNLGFTITMANESVGVNELSQAYSESSIDISDGWTESEKEQMRQEMNSQRTSINKHPENYSKREINKLGVEKISPENGRERAKQLNLSKEVVEDWAESKYPIYFYHNPPVLIVPKNNEL